MRVDSNLEQKIVLFNGLIAFAGAGFERPTIKKIKNMYPAARVPDGTTTLKFLREQGDRRSSHAEHVRQILLRQRHMIAVDAIGRLQQPSA